MYHYRECGLPNVYLANGYREIETPHGRGVAIEDVHGLYKVIAKELVNTKPVLSGPEVKFIRKFLALTQAQFAHLLGVEAQSVRRWEKLPRAPRQADRSVRLMARDILRDIDLPMEKLLEKLTKAHAPKRYQYRHRDSDWLPVREAA